MNLTTTDRAGTTIVHVGAPRIDAAAAIEFKDAMRELTRGAGPHIVLDLGGVDFIDSSGLGAIVASLKQLDDHQRLDLAALRPTVDKVFKLTRMDTIFVIYPTLDDAFADQDA